MGYFTAKQFSEIWGISQRRIIKLCQEERIDGAMKNGMVWLIPENTIKPSDQRNKVLKKIVTQKRVMVVNFNNQLGYALIPLLKKEGLTIDGLCDEKAQIDSSQILDLNIFKANFQDENSMSNILKETNKYYEGLIFIDIDKNTFKNRQWFILEFAKKMNCESSIVLVNSKKNKEKNLSDDQIKNLKNTLGVRSNSIVINAPFDKQILLNEDQISEDILALLTKFKNTTGTEIITDGGYLEFDKNGVTKGLEVGDFYRAIINYLKKLNKASYMWCASTMLEDEWTEEPLEMNFMVNNLDAANRGAKIDRIFIFSKNKIKDFKENKTLKLYMQSNINAMFVDYDEVKQKDPNLLKVVGNGWDGINKDVLIEDLPEGSKQRGYLSINQKEINQAYDCFQKLKKYAKDLKEILV